MKKKIWKKSDKKKKWPMMERKKTYDKKTQNHRMNGFIFHYIKNSNKRGTNGLQKKLCCESFFFNLLAKVI